MGQFSAGEGFNIIPDTATLKGTVRATDTETRQTMKTRIYEAIDYIVKAYHSTYEINWVDGYSACVNDLAATEIVRFAANKIVGEKAQIELLAMMGSEDFSAYAEVAQGSFFALGGGSTEDGCTYSLHHPKFKVNEDALVIGMQMHGQISLDVLSGEVTQKA